MAHVRFLNLVPLKGGIMSFFGPGSTDGQPLQVAPPSNFYATYLGLAPVRTTFRVFRMENLQTEVKSVDAPLRVDGYFTVLMHLQADGQPKLEVIDETPDPKVNPVNRLTVRQFFRDAQVVITVGGRQRSNSLAYAETQTLTDLPDGTVPLSMVATLAAGGAPRSVNLDISFQHSRHVTVFIAADPYDRLRPRVMTDGPPRAEEDAAAAAFRATGGASQVSTP